MTAAARFPLDGRRVWIAGADGMLGRALVRRLPRSCRLLAPARADLDLTDTAAVTAWVRGRRPEVVFLAAARVGGIAEMAARPADYLRDNLVLQANVIEAARLAGATRLVLVASAAVYPAAAAVPTAESALLDGPLDHHTQWYGLAKIAGVKLCEAYRRQYGCAFTAVVPPNLYGPWDRFAGPAARMVAALIGRLHEGKVAGLPAVDVWGSGRPTRELMYVDDCAEALLDVARHVDLAVVNVGSGTEVAVAEVAARIAAIVGYQGELRFLADKPDGIARSRLDCRLYQASRPVSEGAAATGLDEGLSQTYRWFLARRADPAPDD